MSGYWKRVIWRGVRHWHLVKTASNTVLTYAAPVVDSTGYAYQYVETDENDLTYFIHHQLDVICKAIGKLEDYITKKQNEIRRIETKLKRMPLNYRQLALLGHAVRHPGYIYTIRSHRVSHDCAYATARSDLMKLASSQLLEQKQIDQRTLGFIAPENLESRIDVKNT